ncbi:uncharacterized protein LOC142009186 [Carettochelys insculpta]|uniref:uncharacterized protein LOC142009186 n=1 Tax=Carettochelys insculpta TaxID=44489 RepID=UPI003EC02071
MATARERAPAPALPSRPTGRGQRQPPLASARAAPRGTRPAPPPAAGTCLRLRLRLRLRFAFASDCSVEKLMSGFEPETSRTENMGPYNTAAPFKDQASIATQTDSPREELEPAQPGPAPQREGTPPPPTQAHGPMIQCLPDEDGNRAVAAAIREQTEFALQQLQKEEEWHRDWVQASDQWLARVDRTLDLMDAWLAQDAPPTAPAPPSPPTDNVPPAPPELMPQVLLEALQWVVDMAFAPAL